MVRVRALGAAQGRVVNLALAVLLLALAAVGLGLGSAVGFAIVRALAAQLGLRCFPFVAAHCLPRFYYLSAP